MEKTIHTKLDVLIDQTQKVRENVDDAKNIINQDGNDLSRVRISLATIEAQNEEIVKGLKSFKDELRQVVEDTVRQEVGKAIKKELQKIEMANPKKVFVVKGEGIINLIKNLFRRK